MAKFPKYYITKFSKEDSAQHPAVPSSSSQKNWLGQKKHQINPQTEVDSWVKEEPSSA
jgi:hypothetical protein